MRLVAAYSKGNADIAEVGADIIVDGAKLGIFILGGLRQFDCFRSNFRRRLSAVLLQIDVPVANVSPSLKRGKLDFGRRELATLGLIGSLLLILAFLLGRFVLKLRSSPCKDAARTCFGNAWLQLWALPFDGPVMRNADLEFLTQKDGIVREIKCKPKLARRQGVGGAPVRLKFEHIAHTQTFHGNVSLVQVTVKGSLPGNLGRHVLDSIRGCEDGSAIRLSHLDIVDIDCSGRAFVREGKDAKMLDASAGLNTDSTGQFPDGRSVIFESEVSNVFLADKGFTRIVGLYIG